MNSVTARTGEVLSPSQVRCFMDCQMRWWFKYALKRADPATGKMALGRAIIYLRNTQGPVTLGGGR